MKVVKEWTWILMIQAKNCRCFCCCCCQCSYYAMIICWECSVRPCVVRFFKLKNNANLFWHLLNIKVFFGLVELVLDNIRREIIIFVLRSTLLDEILLRGQKAEITESWFSFSVFCLCIIHRLFNVDDPRTRFIPVKWTEPKKNCVRF